MVTSALWLFVIYFVVCVLASSSPSWPQEQWRIDLNFTCNLGPTLIPGTTSVFLAGGNKIALVDFSSKAGKVIWRRDVNDSIEYDSSLDLVNEPFVYRNKTNGNSFIIYQAENQHVIAVNTFNGEQMWRVNCGDGDTAVYGAICEDYLVIIDYTGVLKAVRLTDGMVRPLGKVVESWEDAGAASATSGGIFVTAGRTDSMKSSIVSAFRPADAFQSGIEGNVSPIWQHHFPNLYANIFNLKFVQNEKSIIVGFVDNNGDNVFYLLNAANGNIIWKNPKKNELGGFLGSIGNDGYFTGTGNYTRGVNLTNGETFWTVDYLPQYDQFESIRLQEKYLLAYMGLPPSEKGWPFSILNRFIGKRYCKLYLPSPGRGVPSGAGRENPPPVLNDQFFFFLFDMGVSAATIEGGNVVWTNVSYTMTTSLRLYGGGNLLLLTFSPKPGDGYIVGFNVSVLSKKKK